MAIRNEWIMNMWTVQIDNKRRGWIRWMAGLVYLLEHVERLLEQGNGRRIFGHGQMNSEQHLFGGDVVDQGVRQGHRR